MAILLAFMAIFGMVIVGSVWRGYVFSVLWKWFIVSFGATAGVTIPLLSIPLAIGIGMVISFLVYQYQYSKDERTELEKVSTSWGMMLLYPALVLLCGWVVTLFL